MKRYKFKEKVNYDVEKFCIFSHALRIEAIALGSSCILCIKLVTSNYLFHFIKG